MQQTIKKLFSQIEINMQNHWVWNIYTLFWLLAALVIPKTRNLEQAKPKFPRKFVCFFFLIPSIKRAWFVIGLLAALVIPKTGNLEQAKPKFLWKFVCFFFLIPSIKRAWFGFKKKKPSTDVLGFACGETGIRTQGTLLGYAYLANKSFRPLRHLSV